MYKRDIIQATSIEQAIEMLINFDIKEKRTGIEETN